ncbi:MAG: sensor histidine kinase [Kiloniellales bacterium]|nr:sensor histidine kinase [Kiloniellales bacterium]
MLNAAFIVIVSFLYVCLLFAIATYVDKRADAGRSLLLHNPYIYALSIAVYCTSWTYYGSVGLAASAGIAFLPVYLGPTLVFVIWWYVLRKIVRISKAHRITSIADFISSRYGKSASLSMLVTVIAVVGIIPYISLQLKAVSSSFYVLLEYPDIVMPPPVSERLSLIGDLAFLISMALAVFAIFFGTRHIDASEHHEGLVAAVAFESVIKLIAFLAAGIFVTFGLYHGFGDLFSAAAEVPDVASLFHWGSDQGYSKWVTVTLISMAAIICLPRQFQVTVVENVNEQHLAKAVWLFPLYLLLINIFVLPIAVAGRLMFADGSVDADTYVLALPMAGQHEWLALLVFIGGLSAATGMVIVASVALSTMVCNDLVMPILFRIKSLRLTDRGDLPGLLLYIRRASIVVILLLGYAYFRFIGEADALVTIGLVSFAAAAQFAPAIIGGIFWKNASKAGALTGLSLGFFLWAYTLLLPLFARPGWLPPDFVEQGPFAIGFLRPYELFGMSGLDSLSHGIFWSMLANIGGFLIGSLWSRQSPIERVQAALFVDVFHWSGPVGSSRFWRGSATLADLYALAVRFVGQDQADRAFRGYAANRGLDLNSLQNADAEFVGFTERLLAGAIGAASARVMVSSVAKGEVVGLDEVLEILQETSQVREYSQRLEQKSQELELMTGELREANERLQELDRLKDDFLSTVSHELRTPLTSIRSFSEILVDNPSLSDGERLRFLSIVVKESERLTRLINHILDLAKLDAGSAEWHLQEVDPKEAIEEALEVTDNLFDREGIRLDRVMPEKLPAVKADRDRLIQVIVNLVSNAAKFCNQEDGRCLISAQVRKDSVLVSVSDNGPGVAIENRAIIFDRFRQAGENLVTRPQGTGLGLAICKQIVEFFGGTIWVDGELGKGAVFHFTLPTVEAVRGPQAQRLEGMQVAE